MAADSAQAQTFTVLYSFSGGVDGGDPEGGLITDRQGNLYGTTAVGGNPTCQPYGCGTVFKLDRNQNETVLYSFTGTDGDGYFPWTTLVLDSQGNLYGTTQVGGSAGYGVIFKVDPYGHEIILHSFTDGVDGATPNALSIDSRDTLYGTTIGGGTSTHGTVFKIDTSGVLTTLYQFTGANGDGSGPWGPVVLDGQGNLYGATTWGGSSDKGTIYKLDKAGVESVLFSFHGTDGMFPQSGLIMDGRGNLYGATYTGGKGVAGGNGVVFRLNTKNNKEKVMHSFAASGKMGCHPSGNLVIDAEGSLFGTTIFGGDVPACINCGTVYKVDKTGKETVLHSFQGQEDGSNPYAGLLMDAQGNLYGATTGLNETTGTIFKLTQ